LLLLALLLVTLRHRDLLTTVPFHCACVYPVRGEVSTENALRGFWHVYLRGVGGTTDK